MASKTLSALLASLCLMQLTGCGGGSNSNPEPGNQNTNQAPVYNGGLQAQYNGYNGDAIELGSAQFSDADNDNLTIRYFTLSSDEQRTYLDSNQFTCDSSIVAAGAQADDGTVTKDSVIATVECLLNAQNVADHIAANAASLPILSVNTAVEAMGLEQSVVMTFSRDINNDAKTDLVYGIGYQCQQSDYDAFNAAPFMPAELASPAMYDVYPQYLICLESTKDPAALDITLTEAIENAQVADLLVMAADVKSDNTNDERTVLHRALIERRSDGTEIVEAHGGILVVGEHAPGSLLSCNDGQLKLTSVSNADEAYPRLKRFAFRGDDLLTHGGGIYSDCKIVNRSGVTNQLSDELAVEISFEQLPYIPNLEFDEKDLDFVEQTDRVVAGDFNNDGKNDVIVLDGNQLSWHQNHGERRFSDRMPLVNLPTALANYTVGDVDGDGFADVVVLTPAAVLWYRNNTQQGLEESVFVQSGSFNIENKFNQPGPIQLFDANFDGRMDIVLNRIRNGSDDTIEAFLNLQQGFSEPVTLLSASSIEQFKFADFNGDNKADLIAVGSELLVVEQNENGFSDMPKSYAVNHSDMLGFEVMDIGADGKVEIFIAFKEMVEVYRPGEGQSLTLLNEVKTGGQSSPFAPYSVTTFLDFAVTLSDGVAEVFLPYHWRYIDVGVDAQGHHIGRVQIDAQGDKIGELQITDRQAKGMVVASISSSNAQDLLMINPETDGLGWYYYNEEGNLRINGTIGRNTTPNGYLVSEGKLDDDENQDFLVQNLDGTTYGWTFKDGELQRATGYQLPSLGAKVFADYDNDGDLDVVFEKEDKLYRIDNLGDGFSASPVAMVAIGEQRLYQVKDIDGDGDADLVTIDDEHNTLHFYFNDAGAFSQTMSVNGSALFDTYDFNNDGKSDLLINRFASGDYVYDVYLQSADGFTQANVTISAVTGYRMARNVATVIDYNGDGHLDLLFANKSLANLHTEVFVALNDGFGQFTTPVSVLNIGDDFVSNILTGDFDGDGWQDIVFFAPDKRKMYLFTRQADGQMKQTHRQDYSWGAVFRVSGVADMDNDGKDDLIIWTYADVESAWLLQLTDSGLYQKTKTLYSGESNPYGWPLALTVVDYDNDKDKDVVIVADGKTKLLESK